MTVSLSAAESLKNVGLDPVDRPVTAAMVAMVTSNRAPQFSLRIMELSRGAAGDVSEKRKEEEPAKHLAAAERDDWGYCVRTSSTICSTRPRSAGASFKS